MPAGTPGRRTPGPVRPRRLRSRSSSCRSPVRPTEPSAAGPAVERRRGTSRWHEARAPRPATRAIGADSDIATPRPGVRGRSVVQRLSVGSQRRPGGRDARVAPAGTPTSTAAVLLLLQNAERLDAGDGSTAPPRRSPEPRTCGRVALERAILCGELHGENLPPSTLHSNTPISSDANRELRCLVLRLAVRLDVMIVLGAEPARAPRRAPGRGPCWRRRRLTGQRVRDHDLAVPVVAGAGTGHERRAGGTLTRPPAAATAATGRLSTATPPPPNRPPPPPPPPPTLTSDIAPAPDPPCNDEPAVSENRCCSSRPFHRSSRFHHRLHRLWSRPLRPNLGGRPRAPRRRPRRRREPREDVGPAAATTTSDEQQGRPTAEDLRVSTAAAAGALAIRVREARPSTRDTPRAAARAGGSGAVRELSVAAPRADDDGQRLVRRHGSEFTIAAPRASSPPDVGSPGMAPPRPPSAPNASMASDVTPAGTGTSPTP